MNFLLMKCPYSSVLKNSRIKLRCKSCALGRSLLNILEEMPREGNSRETRQNDLNFIGLEIFGNSSNTSPCAVSLNTTSRSYLFNCGEGLQKIWTEYKIRASKYSDIFITYPSWKNIGGLMGVTLSLQESKVKSLAVHGHPCLEKLFTLFKYIVNFKGIKSTVNFCGNYSTFRDEFITVKFIHLTRPPPVLLDKCITTSPQHECDEVGTSSVLFKTDLSGKKKYIKGTQVKWDESYNSKKVEMYLENDAKFGTEENFALSFIVYTEKSAGSLSFEKCMDLGVPIGPLLGKLKKGEDVKLENGKIVKSSDVKFPDLPGAIIIVVECPTEDYLDALLNEPAFFNHQTENIEHFSCVVVHFSKSEIIKNKKYQQWIDCFHKDTKHVFVNESSEIGGFVGVHRHQFKLNMVHQEIFPLLQTHGIPNFPRAQHCATDEGHVAVDIPACAHGKNSSLHIHSDKTHYLCKDNNNISGEALCEINVKPRKNFDYTKCLTLKQNEFIKELFDFPNFSGELDKLKIKIKNVEKGLKWEKRIYPKIVFLGTGSKKPSKTRSASGIIIFLDEKKSVIFDCGESTYLQLLTFFGKEKTDEILRNLGAIFISHMHIDHHLGLPTLLLKRKIAFDDLNASQASKSTNNNSFSPLTVIAPVQLLPILLYFTVECSETPDLFKLIPCPTFFEFPTKSEIKQIISSLNLDMLQTTRVNHAPHSFGIAIKHKDNWKLTYSGDTQPCENLIRIGKDSDVLIHEATFDDVFETEAAEKLHSTTGQAVTVGRKMNAKFILLTHFSQRYCHLPMINEELLSENNVGLAFDFMQVSLNQLPILPHLYESLKLVFSTYQEKLEYRDMLLRIKKKNKHGESSSYRVNGNHRRRSFSFVDNIPLKLPKL